MFFVPGVLVVLAAPFSPPVTMRSAAWALICADTAIRFVKTRFAF
jgi:hypothetical protein